MATEVAGVAPLSVLLLEDDPFDAELTQEYLRVGGWRDCRVELVQTEPEFRSALARGGHDIVLSDFSLPAFSGAEALAIAREHDPTLPFIFVSGVLGEEHVVDMLKQGATDYVVKARMERLPLVVGRALAEVAERRRREQTERALHESETMFARLVDSLQDHAVLLLSPTGEIRSWNHAAHKLFGQGFDEVRGRSADLLFVEADREAGALAAQLERAAREGQSLDDRWLLSRDGRTFYSSGVFTALRGDDGRLHGFSMIARDITDRMRAAHALETAKDEAEKANRAKNRFLAVLSHELRTPLTPLLSVAHLLQRRPNLPDDMARLVAMIRRNVELEARLIDDLLDLTAIERGKLRLERAPVELHATLRSALDMSSSEIDRKRIRVDLRLRAVHTRTLGDDARLQQVFWNLIRNAVKFSPHGSRLLIESANPEPQRFVMRVIDEGVGISAEALPRIFRLFEQAAQEEQPPGGYGGLGIGLSIARALAEGHGGSLAARSDGPGRGATFTCSLPLAAVQPAPAIEVGAPAVATAPRAGGRVLLVEDHADVAEAVRALLEATGHSVHHADSLQAARRALEQGRFDLLLCDLGLPDGSGYDVLAIAGSGTPAIAMSGYGMEADLRRTQQAGFARHIVKPFEPERLHEAVRSVLDGGTPARR